MTYTAHEADGDLHIRLCDSSNVHGMDRSRCVVAEIIPELPCDAPPDCGVHVGDAITVRGIARYDAEAAHHWNEIHPVTAARHDN